VFTAPFTWKGVMKGKGKCEQVRMEEVAERKSKYVQKVAA
jgi:hypothetical protein